MLLDKIRIQDDFVSDRRLQFKLAEMHNDLLPDPKEGAAVWKFADAAHRTPKAIRDLTCMIVTSQSIDDVVAIEYWTNTIISGGRISPHIDKDEVLYRRFGRLVCPLFSAVYFARECMFAGGALRVAETKITPHRNRLVVFEGNLEHEVIKVSQGIRYSLVINFWQFCPSSL